MATIGICRALHTYHYYPLWKTFFESLGFEVVLSPPTNRETVETGVKVSPPELCLPVKVFLGQVEMLRRRVDKLFLPRLVCQRLGKEWFFGCPKAIALPDLTRAVFSSLSETVELIIDQRIKTEEASFREIAQRLGINGSLAKKAFKEAQIVSSAAEEKTRKEGSPEHIFQEPVTRPIAFRHCEPRRGQVISPHSGSGQNQEEKRIGERFLAKIGVIGHPYLLFDNCINLGLWNILTELEVLPLVSFPDKSLIEKETQKGKRVNWYYEMELLASVSNFLQTEEINGLLLIASFSCGTASVVNEIIRREIAREARVPILTILLDEHTAEAGLRTRLESFADILKRKA